MQSKQHPLRFNVGFLLHESVGTHRDFELDIAHIQIANDLDVSDLRGTIRLTRTTEGILAQGEINGLTQSLCVRCLDEIKQSLGVTLGDLFAYPASTAPEASLTVPETGILELTPHVREYFLLAAPMQPLCKQDCKGLCPECGGNLNEESCDHPESDIDPRFEVLKSLIAES
jgi:uncharacterized protein